MNASQATEWVHALETAFDVPLSETRRRFYQDAVAEQSMELAALAFQRLIRSAKRFPSVAEVLDAFAAVQETTRDVERSRAGSPELRAREQRDLERYRELEPVFYHRDLYWGYVEALREYREQKRSLESLHLLRRTVIEQARARGTPPQPAPEPDAPMSPSRTETPEPTARSSGIEASLPRGDQA